MSKNFTESKVKAALRAAFGFEPNLVEAHCFMMCDYFFRTSQEMKVEIVKGDVYNNGAFFYVTIFGKKFRRFVHYSMMNDRFHEMVGSASYFEIKDLNDKSFEVTTFAFGLTWTKFVRHV